MSANLSVDAPHVLGGLVIAIALPGCKQSPTSSGETQDPRTQCLAAHRHRQQHHLLLRSRGDGPGRLHLAAHAGRRRTRRRPRTHQGRVRTARRSVHQQPDRRADHRRQHQRARRLGKTAQGRRHGAASAGDARPRRNGASMRATARSSTASIVSPHVKKLKFGEVVEAAAKLPVPKDVPLKPASQFTMIGKPQRRKDTPAKVDGSAIFGIDVKLPGMLYAALAQPPTLGGSVKTFNDEKARAMPGVRGHGAHVLRRRRGRRFLVACPQGARRAAASSGTPVPTPRSTTRRSRRCCARARRAPGAWRATTATPPRPSRARRAWCAPTTNCRCSRTPRSSRRTARPTCAPTAPTSTCPRRSSRSRRPRPPRPRASIPSR